MRKTKFFLACVATLSIMSFIAPIGADAQETCQGVTYETTAVSGDSGIELQKANIYWRFKTVNGRVYKRLFDYDKNMWLGEWIIVK